MTTRLCPPDAATLANECKLGLAQEVFTPVPPDTYRSFFMSVAWMTRLDSGFPA